MHVARDRDDSVLFKTQDSPASRYSLASWLANVPAGNSSVRGISSHSPSAHVTSSTVPFSLSKRMAAGGGTREGGVVGVVGSSAGASDDTEDRVATLTIVVGATPANRQRAQTWFENFFGAAEESDREQAALAAALRAVRRRAAATWGARAATAAWR